MPQPIIEVRNVSKKYRLGKIGMTSFRDEIGRLTDRLRGRGQPDTKPETDFWALRDVSFDVQPGEVIGIIGRNGAGKSTLLKILSRITEPTTGDIRMRGRLASLLEVGTGFHPELSGRENVFLNGAILGMRKQEIARKFDEIVEFSEIGKFIDTPVKRYSSGMYVRLAFAVAAHLEPDILIIDEILAVGDAHFQEKCVGKMQEVSSKSGRTIIFVSHNVPTIRHLCQRVVWLKNGSIFTSGPTRPITEQYLLETTPKEHHQGVFSSPEFKLELKWREGNDGRPVDALFFGHDYSLLCRLNSSLPGRRGHLLIEFVDVNGEIVSSICSPEEGIPWFRLENENVFAARFNPLQLFPGNYTLNAFLFDAESGSCLVEARVIAQLQVLESHISNSNVSYANRHGVARLCSRFELLTPPAK